MKRVLRLARAVRDHIAPAGLAAHLDGFDGLGHRADLVQLDQHGVGRLLGDAAGDVAACWSRNMSSPTICTRPPSAAVCAVNPAQSFSPSPSSMRHDRIGVEPAAHRARSSRALLFVPPPDLRAGRSRRPSRTRWRPDPARWPTSCPARSPAASIASTISSQAASLLRGSGAKPPSSPTAVRQAALVQDALQRVERLGAVAQRLARSSARRAARS